MVLFTNKYQNSRNLLIFSFVVLIVVPLVALSFLSYFFFSNMTRNNLNEQYIENANHIALNLEYKQISLGNVVQRFVRDSLIQELLQENSFDISLSRDQENRFVQLKESVDSCVRITLVNSSRQALFYDAVLHLADDPVSRSNWYNKTISGDYSLYWNGKHEIELESSLKKEVFSVSYPIFSNSTSDIIGVVHIELEPEFFEGLYDLKIPESDLWIIDPTFRIMISTTGEGENTITPFASLIGKGSGTFPDKSENSFYLHSAPNNHDWRIMVKYSNKEIDHEIIQSWKYIFIAIICCLLIFIGFLFIVLKSFSLPLKYLVNLLNDLKEGHSDVDLSQYPSYEMLTLKNGIVSLVEEKENIRQQLTVSDQEKQVNELMKLQAQMNPHFLYNTLNSIKCIAINNQQLVINNLITSMIKLMQNVINREGVFISLEDELKNLKNYIDLESEIHGKPLNIQFEIDILLEEMLIPNFTLQPLLENAIVHGLHNDPDNGRITIRGYRVDSSLILEVVDSGKGISKDEIAAIMNSDSGSMTRMGIAGTDRKLKILYGEPYGLSFHDLGSEGFMIRVRIPMGTEL
jgi:two-component system, sensor histidine kinase YesM